MTTGGFGLAPADLRREAARFGVSDDQVRRDHAISHILAALSVRVRDKVIFFGGTALSRTHLIAGRLSEDIDLIALGSRTEVIDDVRAAIEQGLLRSHGRITWDPNFTRRDIDPAVVTTQAGIIVRVQVLNRVGYADWPVELTELDQRYSDVPPARLRVPTVGSFAAWKTAAWFDRRAARDLYDLWALAERRHITPEAAELFIRYGPTHSPPRPFMFDKAPSDSEWYAQLAGQTRLAVTARDALAVVRDAWAAAVGEDRDARS